MKSEFKIGLFLALFCNAVRTEVNNQTLTDYYVNLINKRSVEAEEYVFAKDARMHEAEDKVPSGKNNHVKEYYYTVVQTYRVFQ